MSANLNPRSGALDGHETGCHRGARDPRARVWPVGRPEAHKPITSPYTYNDDVFPIVRDRCGRCHVAGGVAPMSLMTAKDAVPWGESIRTELIAGHMPPWSVDAAPGRFKNAQTLTARELNVLLTWVTGGNPVGNLEHAPPPVTLHSDAAPGPAGSRAAAVRSHATGRHAGTDAGVHACRPRRGARDGFARSTSCPAHRRSCAARPFS